MTMLTLSRLSFRKSVYIALAFIIAITSVTLFSKPAQAAAMQTRTGYYIGNGGESYVQNIGFQPDFVMVKQASGNAVSYFKTSAMGTNETAVFSAAANLTSNLMSLTSSGFTTRGILSNSNELFHWVAIGGSDCSASGTFCVGSYTGSGATTQAISTGFQPNVVVSKRNSTNSATFRTASMANGAGEYMTTTAAPAAGTLYTTLDATGFTAGSANAVSGGVYHFFAFAESSQMKQGTYTGDGTDNREINGLGFTPSALFAKNTTSGTATNRRMLLNTTHHYGESTSYIAELTVNGANSIKALIPDGFRLGTGMANQASTTIYWFAFGPEPQPNPASGSFNFLEGSYTGTGSPLSVSGLPFKPDLVIIKDDAANPAVFRTSLMAGDTSVYFTESTAPFAGGVSAIQANGFDIGTSAATNTTGNTYRWQAFGNAYNPSANSGAADFAIGAYYGNSIDNRDIVGLPFTPNLVTVRSSIAYPGVFRTSEHPADRTSYFSATTDVANLIQTFLPNGFQVGTNPSANGGTNVNWWFAFKTGNNLRIGTYTGNATSSQSVALESYRPNYMWVEQVNSPLNAIARPTSIIDETSQSFANTANSTDGIRSLNGGGFTVASSFNSAATVYRYIAWRQPLPQTLTTSFVGADGLTISNPAIAFAPYATSFTCNVSTGLMGTNLQKLRISNQRSSASWTTSIAATGGQSALWTSTDASKTYDYNDTTNGGCSDGADADSVGGSLEVRPAGATIQAEQFCSTTNVSAGANQTFSQGSVSSITIASAATGADTGCYWDITNIGLRQTIPLEQLPDTYQLNLTVTTVAS